MKKLMIAAAAAAMIGSVEAAYNDDVIYQATYNLKTTIGKAAADPNRYELGKTGTTFWYQDPALDGTYWTVDSLSPLKITLIDKVNFKLVKKAGNSVPALTSAGLKDDAIMTLLVGLAPTYDERSANQPCLTFTYAAQHCYRIAGTIKIDGYFQDSECLKSSDANALLVLDNFGAASFAKANKVELYIETFVTKNPGATYDPNFLWDKNRNPVAVRDNARYPSDRIITELSIAGHGTYGKVFDKDDATHKRYGMTQVSGYAVGTADMPTCETCCAPGTPVDVIFDCCLVGPIDTAVFGTFTFKYNDAETRKLY